ncbi:MAG: prolipoprotein diacylglyceryl transferase [Mesorhizobium sp.]|nr:prolipoprotein diacylglyceryl transferase [Mesorhizobium sp.]
MPEMLLLPLSAITFPNIDPVALQIGPLAIRWYGLAWIGGILFAWWYAKRLVANESLWAGGRPPCKAEDIDDFLIWAAIGMLLGGRVGYVLFYDLGAFAANPLQIFAIWQGGMSFHGGFLGITAAMILFAHRRGVNVWSLFDVIAAGAPIGLGLVRLTNFVNSELWGRPTDMPWGVIFPNGGPFARHPSQLYEAALEGLVLFLVLRLLTHYARQLRAPGLVAGAFVAGYGLSRIIVEFYREPDAHIGYLAGNWLTMGMLLSLPMVLVGLWAIVSARMAANTPAR